jgi:hypothetical protein
VHLEPKGQQTGEMQPVLARVGGPYPFLESDESRLDETPESSPLLYS